jgi:type IV secretory pathway VirD2 relaxase
MSPTRDDSDDLPIFRPRLGRGPRPSAREPTLRNALLRGLRRSAALARTRATAAAARYGASARRVVIKAHVARLTASGAKAAALHLRYIQRDGVERDGSKGSLYDAQGSARPGAFEEPRPGENHQFRLIISPEDASELDLTAFVRRLMTRVQRDLGRDLDWAAVNHHDTDHPHAHVVLRGVDRDGREVRLDRAYISNGLRWRAQEIATEELGPRRESDIRRAHTKELAAERFTSLDRELARRLDGDRVRVGRDQSRGTVDDALLVGRLEHLETLRLAERVSRAEWALAARWQETLRAWGARGDIIKQIHAVISGDPARYRILRSGEPLEPDRADGTRARVVTGRVAGKGLSDELKGPYYAVVETPAGHAYHVPLDPRSADALRQGDWVSLRSEPEAAIRSVDRHIADVARGQDGVYRLEPVSDDAAATPRTLGRLRQLERLGVVTALAPNAWAVAPNLLNRLEECARDTSARHRLLLRKEPLSVAEQVDYPGPVWLDRLDPHSLAPYGLGTEVQRALQERRSALRQLGVGGDPPPRLAALRELERQTLGWEVAASSGLAFLPTPPDGMRGTARIHTSRAGTRHVIVSDGSRFAVFNLTRALRDLEGKAVTISHAPDGRTGLRVASDRDLGR